MKNLAKYLLLVAGVFLFGCAHNPYTAEESFGCDKGILNLNVNTEAFYYCVQNNKKMKAEYEYQQRLQADPEFKKNEEKRLAALEKQRMAEQQKERELAVRRKNAKQVGTSIGEFIICFGEPEQRELVNGQDVFWYDDPIQPMFVIFKDKKLISMFVDRQTVQDRRNNAQAAVDRADIERRHREQIEEQKASRWQQAIQFNQALQQSKQPTTTNCYRTYSGIQCTSW